MKIEVELTNKLFLLPGSGEGSALIDSDPVVTKDGFPYLPGRTFKGLFKESLQEVLEIEGQEKNKDQICTVLFGKSDGDQEALLKFRNLYLKDWKGIQAQLPAFKAYCPGAFEPERITANYTMEIAQTAVDKTDGIALDKSLRNFRAIKPAQEFRGYIEFDSPDVIPYRELLLKAGRQLRFAGTKRNRGFGEVEVKLSIPEAYFSETQRSERTEKGDGKITGLRIDIVTQSAVILSSLSGDQNTVSSDRFVRGSRIRGLLAERLVKDHRLGKKAHLDQLFQESILSGKIHFQPAYPTGYYPLPFNIHSVKGKPQEPGLDIFRDMEDKPSNTRTLKGLGNLKGNKVSRCNSGTTSRFHNSRLNRSAGRNMEGEEEGGIFYYAGLDGGQHFSGMIKGTPELLAQLQNALPEQWKTTAGKSKSTQYGEVSISIEAVSDLEKQVALPPNGEVLLHFRSPVLLYNDVGLPSPDLENLQRYLRKKGIQARIKAAASGIDTAEFWSRQWGGRTNRMPVFQEGSVFLLEPQNSQGENWNTNWQRIVQEGLGELKEQGFGWVEVEAWANFPKRFEFPDPDAKLNAPEITGSYPGDNPVLTSLLDSWDQNRRTNEVRLAALEQVKPKHQIPNHLLSRLEEKLEDVIQKSRYSSSTPSDFRTWIGDLKEKPAGDTLNRAGLYEMLINFFEILEKGLRPAEDQKIDPSEEQVRLACIAWKAFFKQIRNRNKHRRSHGNG